MQQTLQQESPTRRENFRRVYDRWQKYTLKIDVLPQDEEPAIDMLPTTIMPAVQVSQPKEEQDVPPLDDEGRPYLKAYEPGTPTHVLVDRMVALVYKYTGSYKGMKIVLNRERWIFTGEPLLFHVPVPGEEIPYSYGGEHGYDVMVCGPSTFTIEEE
jgi:hypothetical protein